jgi:hypothetical protein
MSPALGRRAALAAALPAAFLACSPALDWREVRPEGTAVTALFPCRPDKRERDVPIAGTTLRMQLHACDAAGSTFSLAVVDGVEPARVEPVLAALQASAAANVGGGPPRVEPFAPPGATPNRASALVRVQGRRPDGRAVTLHAGFFAHGARVFQATALGERLSEEALRSFFGAIKVTP